MPGIIKIGFTENSVEQRMRELDKTPTPIPFECYYAKRIDKAEFVEKKMHEAFDEFRIRDNREFFRMSPEQAKAALDIAEGEDVTPREDVVETTSDKTALDKERNRNRFNFAQIGIEVGEELEFKKDIWNLFACDWSLDLDEYTRILSLNEIENEISRILKGKQIGRVVIKHEV